ncbi:MAG: hypothetical protein AB1847_03950 [bacterium]
MRKKIFFVFVFIITAGLFCTPCSHAQIVTVFPNPLALDPASPLYGTFQYIPQFPIPTFIFPATYSIINPFYTLINSFLGGVVNTSLPFPLSPVALYEVYDPADPLSSGTLATLSLPVSDVLPLQYQTPTTLGGLGFPSSVTMPVTATYPGALVVNEYTDAYIPPTVFLNYYPYASAAPYPTYFINSYGIVTPSSWSPTTQFTIYSLSVGAAPGTVYVPYVAIYDPVTQTILTAL